MAGLTGCGRSQDCRHGGLRPVVPAAYLTAHGCVYLALLSYHARFAAICPQRATIFQRGLWRVANSGGVAMRQCSPPSQSAVRTSPRVALIDGMHSVRIGPSPSMMPVYKTGISENQLHKVSLRTGGNRPSGQF